MANRRQTLYGLHAVRAVLERRPETVLAAKILRDASGKLAELERSLVGRGIALQRVGRGDLDRLSEGGVHQGIVVEIAAAPEFSIGDFEALVVERGRAVRLLVLDGVEDPRNLGACLRTADAAGIDAVIVPKDHSAKLTATAMKTSTGAAETVPVFRAPNLARALAWIKEAGVWVVGADAAGIDAVVVPRDRSAKLTAAAVKTSTGAAETVPVYRAPNLAQALRWLKEAGVWVVGADAEAPRSLYETKLAPPVAMVLGGEGRGVRRLTRDLCDELVHIPMHGTVESLNVSVATGIVLFELLRQAPK